MVWSYHTTNREPMAKISHLYNELLLLLGQCQQWADIRHLKTLMQMVIGLVCSKCINLIKQTVYVESPEIIHSRRENNLQMLRPLKTLGNGSRIISTFTSNIDNKCADKKLFGCSFVVPKWSIIFAKNYILNKWVRIQERKFNC